MQQEKIKFDAAPAKNMMLLIATPAPHHWIPVYSIFAIAGRCGSLL
jgi:hypothetical protein